MAEETASNPNSSEQIARKPRLWLENKIILLMIFGLVMFIVLALTAFFIGFYMDDKRAIYLSLLVELFAAVLAILFLFREVASADHRFVQIVILMITVASFYAFGWPRSLDLSKPDELTRSFSELAVISVLFLLAELAAFLTLTSEEITSKLKALGGDVVKTVVPINEALQELIEKLETNKIREAVDTLAALMKLSAAVGAFPDAEAKVLSGIASYAKLWAEFLHSAANPRTSESERRLRFCMGFFQTYMNAELRDLGESATTQDGKRHAVGITTVDGVYLEILRHMLSAVEGDQAKMFVWVITNVLPDGFYHWGQDGHRGSYPIMDDFRKAVREFISEGHEYSRLFLLSSHLDRDPDRDKIGIDLKHAKAVEDLNRKILLLIGEDKDDPVELAQPPRFWHNLETLWKKDEALKEIRLLDEIGKGGHIDLDSAKTFYGIIEEETSNKAIGPVGQSKKILRRELDGTMGEYYIRPEKLLDYFAKTYHRNMGSPNEHPMFFMRIGSRAELSPLPARYSDCMIVGLKNGEQYNAIIAVSTDLALNSNTMKMEVFTSKDQLDACMAFWNNAQTNGKMKTLSQFLSELNGSTGGDTEPVKRTETHSSG